MSLLKNTNDPRENKDHIFPVLSADKDELRKDIESEINYICKNKVRFISFCSSFNSENGEIISGWQKSRMWSQYGENHRGLCFVFSKSKLLTYFQNQKIPNNHISNDFIIYDTGYITGKSRVVHVQDTDNKSSNLPEFHVLKNFKDLFFTKNTDYKDENEYRIVIYDPEDKYKLIDVSNSLSGVIMGDNTPEVYISLFSYLCRERRIKLYRTWWETGEQNICDLTTY